MRLRQIRIDRQRLFDRDERLLLKLPIRVAIEEATGVGGGQRRVGEAELRVERRRALESGDGRRRIQDAIGVELMTSA